MSSLTLPFSSPFTLLSVSTASLEAAAAATSLIMDSTNPALASWVPQPISTQAILLPIFASIAMVLLIVPFFYHARLRSIGPSSLIFFNFLVNLFTVTNAILWPTDDYAHWWDGNIFCDVQSKLKWPLVTGTVASTVCITRNLALMFNVDKQVVSPTRGMRRRRMWIDIAICFGIPILQAALHYVIQDIRFYVEPIAGCAPSFDNSWPTIVIMYIWPLIFVLVNAYYAGLVIVRLRTHRAIALSTLAAHSLPLPLFLRLLSMSILLVLLDLPLNIWFFYENLNITWLSYDWTLIHQFFPTIVYLPTLGIRTYDRWFSILEAMFIILFLGLAGDALDMYRRILLRIPYLDRFFPSLKKPRVHRSNRRRVGDRGSSSPGFWSKFSLMSRARAYFESRTNSKSNTSSSSASNSNSASASAAYPSVTGETVLEMSGANGENEGKDIARPSVSHYSPTSAQPMMHVPNYAVVTGHGGSLQTCVAGGARSVRNLDLDMGEVRVERRVEMREEGV